MKTSVNFIGGWLNALFRRGPRCQCLQEHRSQSTAHKTNLLPVKVVFLYKKHAENWGSVLVRFRQAATLLKRYDKNLQVSTSVIEEYKDTADVWILSKTVSDFDGLLVLLEKASRSGSTILVDLVDGNVESTQPFDKFVDGYICSSKTEFEFRIRKAQNAYLVPHPLDRRLKSNSRRITNFRVGYCGAPANAAHLGTNGIETFDASTTQSGLGLHKMNNFLSSLSHHYSVRSYQPHDGFKPALKLFIAANFRAAFIGSKADTESLAWLGDSYPYLASNSSSEEVAKIMHYAKETFGTRVFERAVEQLEELKSDFCEASVTSQLDSAIWQAYLRKNGFYHGNQPDPNPTPWDRHPFSG